MTTGEWILESMKSLDRDIDKVKDSIPHLEKRQARRKKLLKKIIEILALLAIVAVVIFSMVVAGHADTASYYTTQSCIREGTSGIMANGRALNDNALTCASWDFPFGAVLRVTNLGNGKSCEVVVCDRGPNKKLYRAGRKIDLSRRAFGQIALLKQGVAVVKIERVR